MALSTAKARLLMILAGYRNRIVHFYHEIEPDELYQVCAHDLADWSALQRHIETG